MTSEPSSTVSRWKRNVIVLPKTLPRPAIVPDFDELPTPAANIGLEQLECVPRLWDGQANPWVSRPSLDDELNTALEYQYLEQEDDYLKSLQTNPWLSVPSSYDELIPSPRNFYEEQEEPAVFSQQSLVWTSRAQLDDETSTSLMDFWPEQEDDFPKWVQSVSWTSSPQVYDELIPNPVNFYLDQEEEWRTPGPTALVQVLLWTPRAFSDEELNLALESFGIDQEEHWTISIPSALVESVLWTARPSLYDEWIPYLGVEQEECTPRLYDLQTNPWVQAPFTYDETSTALVNAYLEDERYLPVSQNNLWLPSSVVYDETSPLLPLDDEQAPIVPVQSVMWLTAPVTYDELSTSLLAFGIDLEDKRPYPQQTLVWSVLQSRDTEELTSQPVSVLEDEYNSSFIAWESPVGTLRLEASDEFVQTQVDDDCSSPILTWSPPVVALPQTATDELAQLPLVDEQDSFTHTWTPLVGTVPLAPSDEFVHTLPEDETPLLLFSQKTVWVVALTDSEEVMPVGLGEDEAWNGIPIQAPRESWLRVSFGSDEVGVSLASFGLDQEEPWVDRVQTILRFPPAHRDEDLWVLFVAPVPPITDDRLRFTYIVLDSLTFYRTVNDTLRFTREVADGVDFE